MPVIYRCLLCARLTSLFWQQTFFSRADLGCLLPQPAWDGLPHRRLALEMGGRESRSLVTKDRTRPNWNEINLMHIDSKLYLIFWNTFKILFISLKLGEVIQIQQLIQDSTQHGWW